ncbi:hypothetical protein FRC14_002923 [Serendipita sp. 396]|nr:hypothetical protein FRC14_002923 [Serendipita sp. 396]KAG8784171.1 hypothetical protein FRC15_003890 [Serendipita sp. 397]KAG8867783.1 hypothetical protein FRC20_004879 [Serendipita sp. 405]
MAAATHASALTLTTTVSTTIGGSSTLTSSSNDPSLIRRQPTPHGTVETTKILKTQDSNNPTWKMLNQYRVMRSLGKGTHGTVKYCEDMSKDDPTDPDYAAIKIIKRMGNRKRLPRADGRDRTNSALSRIRHEVAVMKRCHHDHIVRLIEVIDDPRSLNVFLVMEYLEGGEIKWRSSDGPILSLDQTRRIVRDVLLGLEYLHFMGIIHRDIKPANMLWTKKRARVKLTDFGVACFSKPVGDSEGDNSLLKTEGTPAFYAPEQAYNQNGLPIPTFPPGQRPPGVKGNQIFPMTKALDIWAFGVSIYCFLFGEPPFWGENVHGLCKGIIESDYEIPEFATCDRIEVKAGGQELADALEMMKGMMTKPVYARMNLEQAKRARWLTSDLEDPDAWIKKTDPETHNDAIVLTADEPKEAVASKGHAPRVSSIMQALFNRRTRTRNYQQFHRRDEAKSIRAGPSVVSLEHSTHRQLPPKPRTFFRQSGDQHHQPMSPVDFAAATSAASSPTGNTHIGDSYFNRAASSNASMSSKVGGLTRMVSSLFRRSKKSSSAEAIMSAPAPFPPIVPRGPHDFSASSSPPNGIGVVSQRSSVTVGTGGPGESELDPLLITYSSDDDDEEEDDEGDVQLLGFGGFDTDLNSGPSPSEGLRSFENFGHFDPERSVTSGLGSVIARSSTAHSDPPRVLLPRYVQHTRPVADDPNSETITSAPASPHQESVYILGADVLNSHHSPPRRQGRVTDRLTRSVGQMEIRSEADEEYDSEEDEEVTIEIRRNRTRFHES